MNYDENTKDFLKRIGETQVSTEPKPIINDIDTQAQSIFDNSTGEDFEPIPNGVYYCHIDKITKKTKYDKFVDVDGVERDNATQTIHIGFRVDGDINGNYQNYYIGDNYVIVSKKIDPKRLTSNANRLRTNFAKLGFTQPNFTTPGVFEEQVKDFVGVKVKVTKTTNISEKTGKAFENISFTVEK